MVTVMTPEKEEFLCIIFNATPAWLREYCALVEADPEVTQDILEFIRGLRVYADRLSTDQARGHRRGATATNEHKMIVLENGH